MKSGIVFLAIGVVLLAVFLVPLFYCIITAPLIPCACCATPNGDSWEDAVMQIIALLSLVGGLAFTLLGVCVIGDELAEKHK